MAERTLKLTDTEIEALYAATGNINPCMFDEMPDRRKGSRLYVAWESGRAKLAQAMMLRTTTKKATPP